MAAIENEPVRQVSPLIPEAQPARQQMAEKCRSGKVRPWAAQLPKWAAACVSLAVIVGVQHYNGQSETSLNNLKRRFNTLLPMMGKSQPGKSGSAF